MKKFCLFFALALSWACASTPAETGESPVRAATLADCERAASDIQASIERLEQATGADGRTVLTVWSTFDQAYRAWNADFSPCLAQGQDVADRAHIHHTVSRELADREDRALARIIENFRENRLEEAVAVMKARYQAGRRVAPELKDEAELVSLHWSRALLTRFEEQESYSELSDTEMTCIFSEQRIEPGPPELTFTMLIRSSTYVHALCRLPAPARSYGGDPNGEIVMIFHDQDDPDEGELARATLGPPERWDETRFFTGRFRVPQGIAHDTESQFFHITLRVERPNMGNERGATAGFFWHR